MVSQLDSFHPQHPHHLACPNCGQRSVVLHGESRYICINCGWFRDVTEDLSQFPFLPIVLTILMIIALL